MIHAFGARTALLATGAFLPALAILTWPLLTKLDAPEPAVELLRGIEILTPLPPATLDRLARSLVEVRPPAGSEIVRKGDHGDHFYVIEEGELEVEGKVLGPGAAACAGTSDFLGAVTGHEASTSAADAIIARRLATFAPT